MTGQVNSNLEAVLSIGAFGPNNTAIEADCVIDTGFSESLTLPQRLIDELNLRWVSVQNVELADGKIIACDVFACELEWAGEQLFVEVDQAETDPLIGMGLMHGYKVQIDVRSGGTVTIEKLS